MYSDNGPQYNNRYFSNIATEWSFSHKTSRFPQSNGMAEQFVSIFKNIFKKSVYDATDPYLSFLEFRNTPITDEIVLPTELLY